MKYFSVNIFIGLLALASIVVLPSFAQTPTTHELDKYSFEMYLAEFGKRYDDPEEYRKRSQIFSNNLAEVKMLNKASHHSLQFGINQFSDLTNEEFTKQMNGRVSTDQSMSLLERSSYIYKAVNVPEAMSWQDAEKPVLSAIKNQGRCGSCWAHAATESVESMYAIETGKLFNLSTQQVTSCTNNSHHCGGTGGCGGGTVQLAWEYVKSAGGLTLNETYPYISGNTQETETCQLNTSVPREVKVYSYVTLPHNDYDAIIEALATVGPLAVSVDASQWRSYVSGIFDLCGKNGSNITINHAVQLVGYGSDNVTKQDYWIVRNSWGKDWGENGYIRLLRKKKDDICAFVEDWNTIGGGCKNDKNVTITACGMCGILYDVSYPRVTKTPEKDKRVWIAGLAFGALALLMISLVIYSKCHSTKPVIEVGLLDGEGESVYVKS